MGLRNEIQALVDEGAERRRLCREDDDCTCSYKDCYECGKWHNCHHTPLTQVAEILSRYPAPKPTHEARKPHPLTMAGKGPR